MVGDKITLTMEDMHKGMVKDSFFFIYKNRTDNGRHRHKCQQTFLKTNKPTENEEKPNAKKKGQTPRRKYKPGQQKQTKKTNKITVSDLDRRTKQQQTLAKPNQKRLKRNPKERSRRIERMKRNQKTKQKGQPLGGKYKPGQQKQPKKKHKIAE